jgi:NAD(P)-dependent dehydrogenase (short-subunit alcohol dehydrogenase family)
MIPDDAIALVVSASGDIDDQLSTNVTGPYALLRQFPPLVTQSKGQVVFVNSSRTAKASAETGQCAATKHALKAIAGSLWDEVNRGRGACDVHIRRTNTFNPSTFLVSSARSATLEDGRNDGCHCTSDAKIPTAKPMTRAHHFSFLT